MERTSLTDTPDPQSESTGMTRRRLLGSAATVGGLAAAATVLPPNVRKALAAGPPSNGRLSDINWDLERRFISLYD